MIIKEHTHLFEAYADATTVESVVITAPMATVTPHPTKNIYHQRQKACEMHRNMHEALPGGQSC